MGKYRAVMRGTDHGACLVTSFKEGPDGFWVEAPNSFDVTVLENDLTLIRRHSSWRDTFDEYLYLYSKDRNNNRIKLPAQFLAGGFWRDKLYVVERAKDGCVIKENGVQVGSRSWTEPEYGVQFPELFVNKGVLHDVTYAGVHETLTGKCITKERFSSVLPDDDCFYVVRNGKLYVRKNLAERGQEVRFPSPIKLHINNVMPLSDYFYFTAEFEARWPDEDMDTVQNGIGLFRYDNAQNTLEVDMGENKARFPNDPPKYWLPWVKEKFVGLPFLPHDYYDSTFIPVEEPLTQRIVAEEEEEEARLRKSMENGSLDDLV